MTDTPEMIRQRAYRARRTAKLERMQAAIAWANNSLYGSHNYFLSATGGEDDEHHLDRPIEEMKARTNRQWRALSAIVARLEDNTKPLAVELRALAQEALS